MFDAPTDFASFLSWFRQKTEAAWEQLPDAERAGWQKGTKWAGGLDDAQLSSAERFFGHPFPSDFRLFVKTLHTTTRRPKQVRYQGEQGTLTDVAGFYDWVNGREELRQAFATPVEGLLFDVEHNGLWLSEWGEKPQHTRDRQAIVRREALNSSPLIPVFGHRYLVARPPEPGNPVLSIVQSDLIVYGDDLRSYLLTELAELINVPVDPPVKSLKPVRLWGWLA